MGHLRALPELDPADRAGNRRLLRHLGFGRVPDEPADRPPGPVRDAVEVLDRALGLHVVVAVASGLDGDVGRRWVDALDIGAALRDDEHEYLADAADGIRIEDAARSTGAESLAALLWALGLAEHLPLEEPAAWASSVLPGPGEGIADLLEEADLRPSGALLAAWDLAAGMVWALRGDPDLEVGAAPGSLDPYVVRERHTALGWVLGAPHGSAPA